MTLELRPPAECTYDAVSLGEVMLRLDPGEGRIRTAREFERLGRRWRVQRRPGLARCFGLRTAIVTALVRQRGGPPGRGPGAGRAEWTPAWISWVADDGIGRDVRNGLNFTERGFGVRGAKGVSDRGRSAASQLRPGGRRLGAPVRRRWACAGSTPAASSRACRRRRPTSSIAAMEAARRHGTRGLLRPQLPAEPVGVDGRDGARPRGQRAGRRARRRHASATRRTSPPRLGYEVPGAAPDLDRAAPGGRTRPCSGASPRTCRSCRSSRSRCAASRSASRNDWGALAWSGGRRPRPGHPARRPGDPRSRRWRRQLRVRPGLRACSTGLGLAAAVDYGAAHGALAMTTPGDTSMATLAEVEALVRGAGARVQR